jgi:hypothetical protein
MSAMNRTLPHGTLRLHHRWLNWRVVLSIFALVLLAHPAILAIAHHERAVSIADAHRDAARVCVGACPLMSLCLGEAVVQALPRVPAMPIIVFALLAILAFTARWHAGMGVHQTDWFWPRSRHRALLQVFLI